MDWRDSVLLAPRYPVEWRDSVLYPVNWRDSVRLATRYPVDWRDSVLWAPGTLGTGETQSFEPPRYAVD